MPFSEFDRRRQGYRRRQANAWRRTRWLGTILLNVNRGPGTPAYTPEEVYPLEGDPPYTPALSAEELDDTLARLAEFDTLFSAA
jgi:hypothetical protein